MKTKKIKGKKHTWHFVQTGGLLQLQINSIEDVLELDTLDPKLWVALACPVTGLEFSEETLKLLDTDKNGRVRVAEILEAVAFIKKYFKDPSCIMTEGDSIPLEALSEEPFACGHSPVNSAKAVLDILGKNDAKEISLSDISVNDKLFSPAIINGDGVIPPEVIKDEAAALVVKDIVTLTGGCDDISGVKGINREQFESFFKDIRAVKEWRESAQKDAPGIFFLNLNTDAAASAYRSVKDKIDEFFLRCEITSYSTDISNTLHQKEMDLFNAQIADGLSKEKLIQLPVAAVNEEKILPLTKCANPAWKDALETFAKTVVAPIFGEGKTGLNCEEWKKIQSDFDPYMKWYEARPQNGASELPLERVDEILASDAEQVIAWTFEQEEKHPPIALATLDLKKMILYRRDFVTLLRNYVSFEDFYDPAKNAVFQAGTLYINGLSCDLCFKVTDGAKHATMSPLAQCYLLYCDLKRPSEGRTMQIAAMVSAGNSDNLMVGRNGLFYDRDGNDWDATITKIVENPISIKEAFWSPYKKLARMIQEKIAKAAQDAESKVDSKLASAVDKPKAAAEEAKTNMTAKKGIDLGTVAALGVAVSGISAVVGTVLGIMFQKPYMPFVFIIGLLLIISLPSMFLAWMKLRQRNIGPILDASGWAVNGNAKVSLKLGSLLTKTAVRPKNSTLDTYDPFAQKKFPIKRFILCVVLIALVATAIVIIAKNGWNVFKAWDSVKGFFVNLFTRHEPINPVPAE